MITLSKNYKKISFIVLRFIFFFLKEGKKKIKFNFPTIKKNDSQSLCYFEFYLVCLLYCFPHYPLQNVPVFQGIGGQESSCGYRHRERTP